MSTFFEKLKNSKTLFATATKRGGKIVLMGVGVFFTALAIYKAAEGPELLLVKTRSLDPGWYILDPQQPITLSRGTLVRWNFVPPAWLRSSHPDVAPVQFLKRVVGTPGDIVRWEGENLVVCDKVLHECSTVGSAIPHDGAGRPFIKATFPETIPDDQYLLLADHPLSIDSRYLGLIPITSVNGRARPWMVEEQDYPAIIAKTQAWFAEHPITDYRDGKFIGKAKTITIPQNQTAG